MHFADRLQRRIEHTSPVCVGIDPVPERFPQGVPQTIEGLKIFAFGIIDAVFGRAAAVKPNLAFFEAFGWEGMRVFFSVCEYAAKQGLIVIADGKRGDIGSTAEAYAKAYLGASIPVDALTVAPYMGSDSVLPFIEQAKKNDKGLYVLVKTSNKSSGELQDLPVGDEAVHEVLATLVESLSTTCLGEDTHLSCTGAVVGATYPEEMKYLRSLMPHVPFLIPGYGAQGGTADSVKHGFIGRRGAIVNASRSIAEASSGKEWKEAAAKAVDAMAKAIAKSIEI